MNRLALKGKTRLPEPSSFSMMTRGAILAQPNDSASSALSVVEKDEVELTISFTKWVTLCKSLDEGFILYSLHEANFDRIRKTKWEKIVSPF